jgi:hypothetical protein
MIGLIKFNRHGILPIVVNVFGGKLLVCPAKMFQIKCLICNRNSAKNNQPVKAFQTCIFIRTFWSMCNERVLA